MGHFLPNLSFCTHPLCLKCTLLKRQDYEKNVSSTGFLEIHGKLQEKHKSITVKCILSIYLLLRAIEELEMQECLLNMQRTFVS